MIHASFESERRRYASVSGAYQYDTGQRIRMIGLPTPEELAQMDDFLDGDVVTVQAQFSYKGDSQSESRLARFVDEYGAWEADVPDVYLARYSPVTVHVYVGYGKDTESQTLRAKTMYEATFTPISRPAPGEKVTPNQISAWDTLVQEINMTLGRMEQAISNANVAAESVREVITESESATQTSITTTAQASKWANATAEAVTLAPGADASVTVTDDGEKKNIIYGIPRGEKGEKGDTGPIGKTGPIGPQGEKGATGAQGIPGIAYTLLWDNLNTDEVGFAPRTLDIDVTPYDMVTVEYKYGELVDLMMQQTATVTSSFGIRLITVAGKAGETAMAQNRDISFRPGKVTIKDGYRGGNLNNEAIIPLYIYGIKFARGD